MLVLALFVLLGQAPEVVTDIRVQGNVLTTDAEMRQLAGVEVGTPFTPDLPDVVTERLKNTRKFESIQVLKAVCVHLPIRRRSSSSSS